MRGIIDNPVFDDLDPRIKDPELAECTAAGCENLRYPEDLIRCDQCGGRCCRKCLAVAEMDLYVCPKCLPLDLEQVA